jgi:hypothetical protein
MNHDRLINYSAFVRHFTHVEYLWSATHMQMVLTVAHIWRHWSRCRESTLCDLVRYPRQVGSSNSVFCDNWTCVEMSVQTIKFLKMWYRASRFIVLRRIHCASPDEKLARYIPRLWGILRFITVFARGRHWIPVQVESSPRRISFRSRKTACFNPSLGLRNGFFPSGVHLRIRATHAAGQHGQSTRSAVESRLSGPNGTKAGRILKMLDSTEDWWKNECKYRLNL